MKIEVITVGKVKETYFVEAASECVKAIRKKAEINLVEVADEKAPENLSEKEELQIKEKEGERILSKIAADSFVVCLAIEGKVMSTEQFKKQILSWREINEKTITFVIGGSLGLSSKVLQRANYKLSFGPMTFPHQLMKVILLEQIALILK